MLVLMLGLAVVARADSGVEDSGVEDSGVEDSGAWDGGAEAVSLAITAPASVDEGEPFQAAVTVVGEVDDWSWDVDQLRGLDEGLFAACGDEEGVLLCTTDDDGVLLLTVRAWDVDGRLLASEGAEVRVDNLAPVLADDAPDSVTVKVGSTSTVSLTVVDVAGDRVTLRLVDGPDWATLSDGEPWSVSLHPTSWTEPVDLWLALEDEEGGRTDLTLEVVVEDGGDSTGEWSDGADDGDGDLDGQGDEVWGRTPDSGCCGGAAVLFLAWPLGSRWRRRRRP